MSLVTCRVFFLLQNRIPLKISLLRQITLEVTDNTAIKGSGKTYFTCFVLLFSHRTTVSRILELSQWFKEVQVSYSQYSELTLSTHFDKCCRFIADDNFD